MAGTKWHCFASCREMYDEHGPIKRCCRERSGHTAAGNAIFAEHEATPEGIQLTHAGRGRTKRCAVRVNNARVRCKGTTPASVLETNGEIHIFPIGKECFVETTDRANRFGAIGGSSSTWTERRGRDARVQFANGTISEVVPRAHRAVKYEPCRVDPGWVCLLQKNTRNHPNRCCV
jgi:hypothetical protein